MGLESPLLGRSPLGLSEYLFPQPSPQCLIVMQQRKQQEMAQPHVFSTQHTLVWLGQIITPYMYGGQVGGVVYVGDGLKQRKWPLSHVSELEQPVPITGRGYQAQCLLRCEGIGKHY